MSEPLVSLVVFVAVIAIAVVIYRWRDRARSADLQEWAGQRDYSYRTEEPGLARSYGQLPRDSGNPPPRFRNVLRGHLNGRALTAFDYSYQTSSTSSGSDGSSSTTTHRLQVVAIQVPHGWPSVRVVPQGLGSRLAVLFGGQDVIIGHERFDRAFRVRAQDEERARRLLAPMAAALLARTDQEFWVDGSTVFAVRHGTLDQADLDSWLGHLKAVLAEAPVPDR